MYLKGMSTVFFLHTPPYTERRCYDEPYRRVRCLLTCFGQLFPDEKEIFGKEGSIVQYHFIGSCLWH